MLLGPVICNEHEGVCYNGSGYTCREASPEAHEATFVTVDVEGAINHAAIGHKRMILVKVERNLADLQFCFYDVLRIRYEPSEKSSYSSSN